MNVLLQILTSVGGKSSVPDTVFSVVGALSNAMEEEFAKYMEAFTPFLYNALGNREEPGLCAMAIGLVSDIVRALQVQSEPYCDTFMNYLLGNLSVSAWSINRTEIADNVQDKSVSNQFRPAILQTFGDIAQAIGSHFEKYLSVVAQVLQTAANVSMGENTALEMLDYVISLREGIMDAWSGTILALKSKRMYAKRDLRVLLTIYSPNFDAVRRNDLHCPDCHSPRSQSKRSTSPVSNGRHWVHSLPALHWVATQLIVTYRDLADTFPNGEYANFYRADSITTLIKETKSNRDFQARTIETARWAREQIKRQSGSVQASQMS